MVVIRKSLCILALNASVMGIHTFSNHPHAVSSHLWDFTNRPSSYTSSHWHHTQTNPVSYTNLEHDDATDWTVSPSALSLLRRESCIPIMISTGDKEDKGDGMPASRSGPNVESLLASNLRRFRHRHGGATATMMVIKASKADIMPKTMTRTLEY